MFELFFIYIKNLITAKYRIFRIKWHLPDEVMVKLVRVEVMDLAHDSDYCWAVDRRAVVGDEVMLAAGDGHQGQD